MMRECLHCHQRFAPGDLSREVSKEIEAERKSCGLGGILFRCYECTHCGRENLFVDVHPLQGESPNAFKRRRSELERAIRQSPREGVAVTLMEKTSRCWP